MMYTFMGLFPILKRELQKECQRIGFNRSEKADFIESVLGEKIMIKNLTISNLELLIRRAKEIKSKEWISQ